jgi:hypothetical protein
MKWPRCCTRRHRLRLPQRRGAVLRRALPGAGKQPARYLDALYAQGLTEDDYRWLSPQQLAEQIRIAKPYGGIYAPTSRPSTRPSWCAAWRGRGGHGRSHLRKQPVTHWQSGSLRTAKASVRSRWVVPAVEGYAATCRRWAVTSCRCRA